MRYIEVNVKELIVADIEDKEFEMIEKKILPILKKEFLSKEAYERENSKKSFQEWKQLNEKIIRLHNDLSSIKIIIDFNQVRLFGIKKLKGLISSLLPEHYLISRMGQHIAMGPTGYYSVQIEPIKGAIETHHLFLYHFSDLKNKDKILRKGIVPKKSTRSLFTYPKRSFYFSYFNLDKIRVMKTSIENYGKTSKNSIKYLIKKSTTPLVVFKIDTSKTNAKFYEDVGSSGVWTDTLLLPECLTIQHEDPINYDDTMSDTLIKELVESCIKLYKCPDKYISWVRKQLYLYLKDLKINPNENKFIRFYPSVYAVINALGNKIIPTNNLTFEEAIEMLKKD